MNIFEIFGMVLSSSVITTLISSGLSWKLRKRNYIDDYHKLIIERRFESQEMVSEIVDEMKIQVHLERGVLCNRIFVNGEDYFDNFVIKVGATSFKSIWLSPQTQTLLTKFNIFLLDKISYKIEGDNLKELGVKHIEDIREFRDKIENQLLVEFRDLHDVEKFIKDKQKGGEEKIPLYGDPNKKLD
jgi:hypothetical protein